MKIKRDDIIFESGRLFKDACNGGVIGLGPDLEYITEGWDGALCSIKSDMTDELSQKEKIEVADYMIKQWEKVKELMLKKAKGRNLK